MIRLETAAKCGLARLVSATGKTQLDSESLTSYWTSTFLHLPGLPDLAQIHNAPDESTTSSPFWCAPAVGWPGVLVGSSLIGAVAP